MMILLTVTDNSFPASDWIFSFIMKTLGAKSTRKMSERKVNGNMKRHSSDLHSIQRKSRCAVEQYNNQSSI
jgi:hypothetical protein